MSTTMNGATALPSTPQSSKKRKSHTETPERSKKKRKHETVENGVVESQESTASKKDKKKKKKDKIETVHIAETQETVDTELSDALLEESAAITEIVPESQPILNGVDSVDAAAQFEQIDDTLLTSQELSSFYQKRISLQLPIPSVSLATPAPSILSLHLAPLLLTYFAPVDGIVLSFSDPVLSATPSHGVNLPLKPPKSGEIPRYPPTETFAKCADVYGVCWVWLTITFLVFRPESGDRLKGWTNVTSEGFVGLVSYNYFQTAIGKTGIPKSWKWDGPTAESRRNKKKTRKGKLRDDDSVGASQEDVAVSQDKPYSKSTENEDSCSFVDADGNKITATQTFSVVDVEMVPGHERDKWTLQIDGTLLSDSEQAAVMEAEKQRFEQAQNRSRSRSKTPGLEADDTLLMTGGLPISRQASPL